MSAYEYKASSATDVGNVKEINQDCVLVKRATYNGEPCMFALVADGMGGLEDGEKASGKVKGYFDMWFRESLPDLLRDEETFAEKLLDGWQKTIERANHELNEEKGRSGTTLTMIFMYKGTYYTANIGDSRIYKCDNKNPMLQITEDHSWAHMAQEDGLSAEEIETHANKNTLTRCIGGRASENPQVDYVSGDYEKGYAFLLCSDGLRHKLKAIEMEEILKDDSVNTKNAVNRLIFLAKQRGEEDNITAAIIKVTKGENFQISVGKTETLEN